MEANAQICVDCSEVIPEREDKKRNRTRKRCTKCAKKHDKEKIKQDPGRYLSTKMQARKRKIGPIKEDEVKLYSRSSAKAIYDSYQGKSYLSNESDLLNLCIAPKVKNPRTQDDFVLLTSKEALLLGKKTTDEEKAIFLKKN